MKWLLFIAFTLFAQVENRSTRDFQDVGPESENPMQQGSVAEPQVTQVATNPRVVSSKGEEIPIQGLVIMKGDLHHTKIKRAKGITLNLGDNTPPSLKAALQPYLRAPLNKTTLDQIKNVILKSYKEDNQEYVIALIPEQKVSDGIIVIQVLEGMAGDISFLGQKWTSKSNLENKIDLYRGNPVDLNQLLNNLAWVNRNPFHSTQMIFSEGKRPNEIDVEFITHDRFTVRPFIGSDNTGVLVNGQTRYYAGFNWGNAFWRDDILTYQYTASNDFHHFQSHVANYTAFINSLQHNLEVYGAYALIHPMIPELRVEGKNAQGSLRYQILHKPLSSRFAGFWEFGCDYKWQNSNLFFTSNPAEVPTPMTLLTINQLLFGYSLRDQLSDHGLSFKAEIIASLWKDLFPHQTGKSFETARPFSKPRYAYLQVALSDQWHFTKNWFLSMLFRGQVATGTLPASEEYGLGGQDTVRGYYEQQFIADNAAVVNLELYAPSFTLFKKLKDTVHILAFVDYAYGYNYHETPGLVQANLLGIGPGVRYDIVPYFHFQADYGFQLLTIPGGTLFGRIQIGGTLSY
jgi:hemolysin activation/secretion protein